MRRLYPKNLYLGLFFCALLFSAWEVNGQCGLGAHTYSPTYTTICSADRVTVTINNSASAGYASQLVSGSTAYSGYFLGTGGILVIESFPISANLTLTIQASRIAAPICTQNVGSIPVTVRSLPTTANAGPDQQGCTGNFTLAANNAAVGTGQWSVVGIDPGVTIADLSSPTSSVSGLPAGSSVTLRWTIYINPCPASFDDVTITRHPAPTPANAGP